MRRIRAALVALVAAMLVLAPTAAHAADPMTASGIVTDTTDTLTGNDVADIESAVDSLQDEDGVTMYLVVVDRFTNPRDGFDWATAFAERNALVSTDIVMYVGLDVAEAGLNVARDLDITDDELDRIQSQEMIPALDRGDLAGAAIDTAHALRAAIGDGSSDPAGDGDGDGGDVASTTGPVAFTVILIVIGIVVVALAAWFIIARSREHRRKRAAMQQREAQLEQLATTASLRLVEADDMLKTAEQDAAFAEAEFGADAAAPFHEAVRAARSRLSQAFSLQGQLLDHVPDSDADQVAWNEQIVALAEEATTIVSAEAETFEQLRVMERNAPQLLERVTGEAEQLAGRLQASTAALEALRVRYAPSALATVDDAVAQATAVVGLAVAEAQQASDRLREGKSGLAAVEIGDAQEALGQGAQLLDSIERTRHDLERAQLLIRDEIADLRGDLARLQAPGRPALSPQFEHGNRSAIAAAEAAIAAAEAAAAAAEPSDPLAVLAGLRTANQQLDEALRATTDEQARLDGVRRRLERATEQARAQVRTLSDYITTHRGIVSATPRARLAQAEGELDKAMRADNPDAALAAVTNAIELSAAGTQAATAEVDRERSRQQYGAGGYGVGGGYGTSNTSGYFGSGSSGGDSRLGEAIVGGIIGGLLSGGGGSRRGGGYGGGFGSGFGSSSRSSSRGGFRSSGGRSSRGFRSSGGRRGGGGRRR